MADGIAKKYKFFSIFFVAWRIDCQFNSDIYEKQYIIEQKYLIITLSS